MKVWVLTQQNPSTTDATKGNGEIVGVWDSINGMVDVTTENLASVIDGATAFTTVTDANRADSITQGTTPSLVIELVQVERTTTLPSGYSLVV